tara:strand:- start:16707 stop:17663 length:957 start_codon:yes stop_codon:yes gene_type:complete
MTNRRITEEQFQTGTAIDASRIQKALDETEEYFNNIPIEAIKERYSLNYMVLTSLNSNVGYDSAAAGTPPILTQSGWSHYSPFLPVGSTHTIKGIFREEDLGGDRINSTTGIKNKSYRVFSASVMFDKPVILDSVCLFMMNRKPEAATGNANYWGTGAGGPANGRVDRFDGDQKYTLAETQATGYRSLQRTRILVDTDDLVASEDRSLSSKEFVLQDFQELFFRPDTWATGSGGAASSSMFPETAESPTGHFIEQFAHQGLYLLKENINIPFHQKARVRFRVVSYADGLSTADQSMIKDIKPENMTFTIVYKEALTSG